jgi:hypothetical protein
MHQRQGATVALRDGWLVATNYPDEPNAGGNAMIDFAHRPTSELNGPDLSRALADLCGSDVLVRTIHGRSDWQAYRLTAGRAIVFGKVAHTIPGALDMTGGWATIALIGPDAEHILNKITAVDLRERTLPVNGCCQGPIFGVNTLFGRFANRLELHVCGDSAEFLWEVLLDAGAAFDLKPAGTEYATRKVAE